MVTAPGEAVVGRGMCSCLIHHGSPASPSSQLHKLAPAWVSATTQESLVGPELLPLGSELPFIS